MRRLFVVSLAVMFAVVLAAPAMATDARLRALGNVGNYIEDDYNIFSWYGTLPNYSDMVFMSVHQNAMYYGEGYWDYDLNTMIGATYALGEYGDYGTLAMFFHRNSAGLNPLYNLSMHGCMFDSEEMVYEGPPWPGADVWSRDLYNKFRIMYGYEMDKFSIGLYFERADAAINGEMTSTSPDTSVTEEYHWAYTTIGAGARFEMNEDLYGDIAFNVDMASQSGMWEEYCEDMVDGYGDIEQDANMAYGFRGRMFYNYNDVVTFVPYVGMRMWDFSLKADSTDFNADVDYYDRYYNDVDGHFGQKGMMFDFGIGANIEVNEDNLLVFAVEPISYMKIEPSEVSEEWMEDAGYSEYSLEVKRMGMPRFRLALESYVKDWLTFRVGGVKSLYKWSYNQEISYEGGPKVTYEWSETTAPFNYFMGLGFHVGDFDIDCVINNELPYHMGYWLTGYGAEDIEDSNDNWPAYMITGVYHF
jgi:hypothetical protein